VVFDLAIVGIVNEDLSTIDGLRRGWEIFQKQPGPDHWHGCDPVDSQHGDRLHLGLPVLLIAAPIILGAISQTRAVFGGGALISMVLFLLYLPILMVAQGILQSYIGSAWTLVFRRLTGRPLRSINNH
jgi:hypothetical protein